MSAQSINNFGIKWIFLYRVQRSISNVWLIDYKASLSRKPKPLIDENVTMIQLHHKNCTAHLKFGYSEKATKFEKIFHLKFDITDWRQILSGIFFQISWPSQNIRTLNQQ